MKPGKRLRYRDRKGVLRYIADTPDNRRKFGALLVPGTVAERGPRATAATVTPGKPAGSQGQGDEKAREAVAGMPGVGKPEVTPGGPATPGAPAATMSYAAVIALLNSIIKVRASDFAMTNEQESAIGTSLDALVAKRWPSMQQAGPEVALTMAVAGWIVPIILKLIFDSTPRPLSAPTLKVAPESVERGDEYAGTQPPGGEL